MNSVLFSPSSLCLNQTVADLCTQHWQEMQSTVKQEKKTPKSLESDKLTVKLKYLHSLRTVGCLDLITPPPQDPPRRPFCQVIGDVACLWSVGKADSRDTFSSVPRSRAKGDREWAPQQTCVKLPQVILYSQDDRFRKWMNLTFIHECTLGGFLISFSLTKLAFQDTEKIPNTKGRGNQVDLNPEIKIEPF